MTWGYQADIIAGIGRKKVILNKQLYCFFQILQDYPILLYDFTAILLWVSIRQEEGLKGTIEKLAWLTFQKFGVVQTIVLETFLILSQAFLFNSSTNWSTLFFQQYNLRHGCPGNESPENESPGNEGPENAWLLYMQKSKISIKFWGKFQERLSKMSPRILVPSKISNFDAKKRKFVPKKDFFAF